VPVSPPQAKSNKIFAPLFSKKRLLLLWVGRQSLIQSAIVGPTRPMTTPATKAPAM
jgi:hypothetical protein